MGEVGQLDTRRWRTDTAREMGVVVGSELGPSSSYRTIHCITSKDWADAASSLEANARAWFEVQGFDAKPGAAAYALNVDGGPGDIWLGVADVADVAQFATLAGRLQPGDYQLAEARYAGQAALGWALGLYKFVPRRTHDGVEPEVRLYVPSSREVTSAIHRAAAIRLTRDLVNAPAHDLGPSELSAATQAVSRQLGAVCHEIVGDDLLKQGFPAIHAVGRAADDAPRLLDMRWGKETDKPLTLIGKGVCFDTGGLNIKAMAGMRHMKRDMGGAAVMIGLAALIMSERLPVRLRVLLPIVENSIAGNAMRPGDLVPTRDGATIEIENTDCEGRIILADALTLAVEDNPDLIIDCATLTGSARTAFGGEIQALFTSDDALGRSLQAAGHEAQDGLWHMPLWEGYRGRVSAPTGDLLNMAPGGYAGAITAALFLQHFARDAKRWAHMDISAWNDSARPGHPVGGEATGLGAMFHFLTTQFV